MRTVVRLRWISFQSTYLYKVRHSSINSSDRMTGFNPRTYIRYDTEVNDNEVFWF